MRLNDNTIYYECSFEQLLPFVNSTAEKNRVLAYNRKIKSSFYPLTKTALQNYYLSTNYTELKKSFKDVNCASQVYSYFVQTYGMPVGSPSGTSGAAGANSSGLNPFFGPGLDLGFNFGSFGSWLWLLLIGAGALYLTKK